MLFNSLEFLVFFPTVFLLYWFVFSKNINARNVFIILVSYLFYGWWDWRFLLLIALSSTVDYSIGWAMSVVKAPSRRKALLVFSVVFNLGLLGYFKYANFFIDSFADLLEFLGFEAHRTSLRVILPVGISFYTFQSLSYTINIYRNLMKPAKDVVAFFAFVSFFPQLVAGPIERASHLLPQFESLRTFSLAKARDASRQILWGFFKKLVIADLCARNADFIFQNHDHLQGSLLVLGAIYFAFQIYCDFSGYSDIAIGTAKLLGFELMINFRVPYFSRNVAEFWRRWHISLSTWFRDYLYIPLGGNRRGLWRNMLNVMIVFTVSGFWHGANWTYVIWGFLNGLFILPMIVAQHSKPATTVVAENRLLPNVREILSMGITFVLICLAWIFFRAENVQQAFSYLAHIPQGLFSMPSNPNLSFNAVYLIIMLMVIEWIMRKKDFQFEISALPVWARWSAYYLLIFMIVQCGQQNVSFIYFQF